jgi:hypothetical protein
MYLFFYCQGHVTAYFGFPTMPGMNDVMYLVVICKFLMYPHLVGWMIPTWLGDGCMYESFGDRKVFYDV